MKLINRIYRLFYITIAVCRRNYTVIYKIPRFFGKINTEIILNNQLKGYNFNVVIVDELR